MGGVGLYIVVCLRINDFLSRVRDNCSLYTPRLTAAQQTVAKQLIDPPHLPFFGRRFFCDSPLKINYQVVPRRRLAWFQFSSLQTGANTSCLGKEVLWTVRGMPKIIWPARTDPRHSVAPSVRPVPLKAWFNLKAPLWLGLHGWPHREGATKPAHDKGHWRVKMLKVTEKKNQNMGPFFLDLTQKVLLRQTKKRDHIFLLGSFRCEKSKRSECMVYDLTLVSLIGFLHMRVEPIITTAFPYMQKKKKKFSPTLAGSHSLVLPTCAHTEKDRWLNY